ncbi:phage portal protein [Sphingomonas naphthae]|uniref:Phage portal protein n=1 Tax=Sphingomonas naphthae TaxID=1813468 RepID=A0ABY7TL16_9SPHN|nr:phage portal protein [Sphingomonas naphthae]WCT73937.1 phage portal protein [Sphingomonas naphthae]
MGEAFAAVAPQAAARRARAHADRALAVAQQRYVDSWSRNDPAARRLERSKDKPHSRDDRARIRDLMVSNPFGVKMLSSLLNDLIGWGITGIPKANKRIVADWKAWIAVCDHDEVLDLYGLQELIARTLLVDGEVFIIRLIDKKAPGNPLRLQVNDADMLDTTLGAGFLGGRVRDGVEYDSHHRPVAYHFRTSREAGNFGGTQRIPAEHVIHLFRRDEPGRRRGRSFFEAILDPIEEIDGYLEAETMRKRIEACFAGFITPAEGDDGDVGAVQRGADGDFDTESLAPGMLTRLRPGETIAFGEPKALGGMGEFMKWGGLRVAAGSAGTTYEDATGDLSNVNFSSFKAGALNKKRFVGRLQYLHLIPRCLDVIWSWWCEAHDMTGRGPGIARATIEWTPPPFESIDRLKEANADAAEIANRTNSRRKIVTAAGYGYDELQDEIAADRKADEARGLPEPAQPGAPAADAPVRKDDEDA